MEPLKPQTSLADQVYNALVDEICNGALPAGAHLVQELLAERLGVSRQPVQQAMARLKADGMVEEQGRRGLWVAPLDPALMRHHYDIRAALDGLAARLAAERMRSDAGLADTFDRRAEQILALGGQAVAAGKVAEQVRHDRALHRLIYEMSGNPLLDRTAEPHWRFLQRAMGEVLRHARLPEEIWRQHAGIVAAISAGAPDRAEALMIEHDLGAATTLGAALAALTPKP
ncbi:MAG TPA: GntR family transcriptional regulator [Pararhodobacter sp.]|uniref:GntR family transcriptional regulator n=1 Tax=Pararhodobacter sp. TaxID=2127056 RepID=UPI001DD7D6D8|nr:GntR family transcriptional regulator [Pararhodobacter sp.]MCB1346574.1 GntR family transcriptional regulator [Paracoccaceae bacterium]HPD93924.1 GntR family transcriptional regulator [Pararhodobacter sp.]